MTEIAGCGYESGSGSIRQRLGSADPGPYCKSTSKDYIAELVPSVYFSGEALTWATGKIYSNRHVERTAS
jgi:hypothetical protein